MTRPIGAGVLVLGLAFLAGCDDDGGGPDAEEYFATLSGANEEPVRNTTATGTAEFEVLTNNTIAYTIDVANITNVTAAHIHGPAAQRVNAGVIVDLFIPPSRTGTVNGRLVTDTITNTNNPSVVSLDSLLVLIRNGNAYVNVHTNDGAGANNTGPGDFAAGEIRGQIQRRTGASASRASNRVD